MYTIKILTHKIRLSDGHVMSDWIDLADMDYEYMEAEAEKIKASINRGEYDTEDYAIRMRRYPKELHLKNVITKTGGLW
jgi:hypothetical protein|tara:strand:- start:259 stop:495 length:237 start_codon:yes stop_codon:yes gene_type:complete